MMAGSGQRAAGGGQAKLCTAFPWHHRADACSGAGGSLRRQTDLLRPSIIAPPHARPLQRLF